MPVGYKNCDHSIKIIKIRLWNKSTQYFIKRYFIFFLTKYLYIVSFHSTESSLNKASSVFWSWISNCSTTSILDEASLAAHVVNIGFKIISRIGDNAVSFQPYYTVLRSWRKIVHQLYEIAARFDEEKISSSR